ncbi:MAG: hypothetical protein KDJ23_16660 [Rhodoblastus sp.]|nr:hypothetical protein [Rhodoblastus sp.]MCB9998997.1 hypothetical protein [Methylobacteriaceae bacterium]MCC0002206.1 hypothetical protein [Methylobacteriaceae bacterium]HPG04624.1 hypothetical protein [Rhodoblastus sp.]
MTNAFEAAWPVFRAADGEVAIRPSDAARYLADCEAQGRRVLGWEAWLVDHALDDANEPAPQAGAWCGLIPVRDGGLVVIGGEGDARAAQREIATTDFDALVAPPLLPFVYINFTFDE